MDGLGTMTAKEYEAVRDQLQKEGLWAVDSYEDEERSARRAEEILQGLRNG